MLNCKVRLSEKGLIQELDNLDYIVIYCKTGRPIFIAHKTGPESILIKSVPDDTVEAIESYERMLNRKYEEEDTGGS